MQTPLGWVDPPGCSPPPPMQTPWGWADPSRPGAQTPPPPPYSQQAGSTHLAGMHPCLQVFIINGRTMVTIFVIFGDEWHPRWLTTCSRYRLTLLLPPANEVCGKVMFLHMSVILSIGGMCGMLVPLPHMPPLPHMTPATHNPCHA